ncbi:MAG: hypothetical protein D6679_11255 [Candidatus Hydrogenedentota bacterium]|nr:MAG: hypothetical protein D6679_11255 [Candidatus Hydrogenedentota bacterium]
MNEHYLLVPFCLLTFAFLFCRIFRVFRGFFPSASSEFSVSSVVLSFITVFHSTLFLFCRIPFQCRPVLSQTRVSALHNTAEMGRRFSNLRRANRALVGDSSSGCARLGMTPRANRQFADWRVYAPNLLFHFAFCLLPFALCLPFFSVFRGSPSLPRPRWLSGFEAAMIRSET